MIKTILIPTDFTAKSLGILKKFLDNSYDGTSYRVILLHGMNLGDSISELMFLNRSEVLKELTNKDFENTIQLIKAEYQEKVYSIHKEIFSGFNQNAFNNFLEGNQVDEILVPDQFSYEYTDKKSFNIMPFIDNANVGSQVIGTRKGTRKLEKMR